MTPYGIVTELGVFADTEARRLGKKVKVMLRPDDVTFVPSSVGDGTIVRRDFRGSENLYCIRLPSGQRVHSSQASATLYPNGTRVRAEAHVIHVVTFPA